MMGPIVTHKNSESTWGDSVRLQEQGGISSGWCEAYSALSFLFPAHEQGEACEVRGRPQRGPLLLHQEHPREVVPLRFHLGVATKERALPCCVWPLYGTVSLKQQHGWIGVCWLHCCAKQPTSLLPASPELPARTSWRSGSLALLSSSGTSRYLHPTWDVTALHHAHSTSFYLQCHLGWWDY